MFSPMGNSNPQDLGNGGEIDGSLTITGDLTVSGGIGLTLSEVIQGTSTIDVDSTEAFLVRKDGDGGDVFTVDTSNMDVTVNGAKNTTTFSVTNNWSTTNDYIRIALNDATIRSTVLDSGARNLILAPLGNDALTLHSTSGGATSVGIGTLTPSTNLHIYSAEDYNPTITIENAHAGSRSPFLSFKKSSSSPANNDKIGQIQFNGNDATGSSRLMAFIEAYTPDVTGGAYDGAFRFSQMINASQTEVMTITGGSVGIGTSSPSVDLHIKDTSGNAQILVDSDSGGAFVDIDAHTGNDAYVRLMEANTVKWNIYNSNSADNLLIASASDTAMVLTQSGSVGIGVTPTSVLHLKQANDGATTEIAIDNSASGGSTDEFVGIRFRHNGGTSAGILSGRDEDFSSSANRSGNLIFRTNKDDSYSEKMRLTSGGSLGIGSSSPISNVEIKGTISSLDGVPSGLVVHDSGTANSGLQLINNSGKFAIHADGANDRVDFYLDDATTGSSFAGSDKLLTLKYGGNVGIGSDSPNQFVEIKRASRTTTFDASNSDTWVDVLVRNPQTTENSATGIAFQLNSTYHTNASTGICAVHQDADYEADMVFITRGHDVVASEKMRLTSGGSLGIGSGSSSPATPLHVADDGSANSIMSNQIVRITPADANNGLNIGSDGTDAMIGVTNNDTDLHFLSRTGGAYSKAMTIDGATGSVGIGTTSINGAFTALGTPMTVAGHQTVAEIYGNQGQDADKGGGLGLGGRYITGSDSATSFAEISGVKANNTSSNYEGEMVFKTRVNGGNQTERMRLTSTGVGIGVTPNADTPLHIFTNSSSTQTIFFDNDGTGRMDFVMRNDRSTEGSASHSIFFDGADNGGNNARYATIENHIVDNADASEDGKLVFSTMVAGIDTETLNITGGSVGIGTSTIGSKLDVVTTSNSDYPLLVRGDIDNDGGYTGIAFSYNGGSGASSYRKASIHVQGTSGTIDPEMHFLINSDGGTTNATIADAVLSLKQGGNIDTNANYIVNEQGNQNHVANTMSSPYYRMDGDGNGFDLDTSANLEPNTGDFSMEAWIYLEDMAGDNHIFASYSSTGIFWKVDDNYLRGLIYDASGNAFTTSNIALATSKWYHVAWTVDRSSATGSKLYINGVESTYSSQADVTGASGTISSTGNKYLSRTYNNTNDGIAGSMAGFKFYNLALSASEIKELYSGASVPFYYKGANQTTLLTNGTFDSNTTGWTAVRSTLASVSGGQSGNCLEITRTGDPAQYAYQNITTVIGKRYRLSAYVKDGSVSGGAFEIYAYGGGAVVGIVSGTTTSSWVKHSVEFTATATTNTIGLRKNNTSAGTMLFDSASVVPIGAVAEYDGSGIASDKWFDKSGNNLHGTVTGASVENAPSDDDGLVYEEGTWTPAFNASGSATVTENHYVRIGNWVRCQANLDNIQSGGSGTSVIITGLPYAPKDNTSSGTFMHRYIDVQSTNVGVVPYITTSSEVYLYETIDDGNWIDMKWSQINNNDDARITFDYLV